MKGEEINNKIYDIKYMIPPAAKLGLHPTVVKLWELANRKRRSGITVTRSNAVPPGLFCFPAGGIVCLSDLIIPPHD